jgi:hypothetical protein
MARHEKPVCLAAADRQLESYLDKDAFERSLVMNVLFQPCVLIPDIFLFISDGIAKHLKEQNLTLLEAGLESGDIVPSFRDKQTSTFSLALDVLRRQKILGIRDDAKNTAMRLDKALDRATTVNATYWPEYSVAEEYERLAVRLLRADDPPALPSQCGIPGERMVELWDATSRWRNECLEEAISETARVGKAKGGLRRGCLMSAVGRELGIIGPDGTINDVTELMDAAVSPKEKYALHYFCRWFTDIYDYNLSSALGATPNFPDYDPLECAMATQLLCETYREGKTSERSDSFRVEAAMPKRESLSALSAQDLLSIKKNVGIQFMFDLEAWQTRPESQKTRMAVESSLVAYGAALVKEVKRASRDSTGLLQAILGRSADQYLTRALGTAIVLGGHELLPEPVRRPVETLVTAGAIGYALYQWRRSQPDAVVVEFGAPEAHTRDYRCADVNILRPVEDGAAVGDC